MQHPPRQHRRRAIGSALAAAALIAAGLTALGAGPAQAATARQVEALDRGVVSGHTDSGNLVSWRWLGTDPNDVSFNVYRAGTLVNSTPITGSTNYFHSGAPAQADYTVRAMVNGAEQGDSVHAIQFRTGYTDSPRPPAAPPPTGSRTPTRPTTRPSATSTATGNSTSSSSGSRRTPRTTPSPATPATRSSTASSSTAPGCGASTWAGTSARAPTTRSSRCTTTTATARRRSP